MIIKGYVLLKTTREETGSAGMEGVSVTRLHFPYISALADGLVKAGGVSKAHARTAPPPSTLMRV